MKVNTTWLELGRFQHQYIPPGFLQLYHSVFLSRHFTLFVVNHELFDCGNSMFSIYLKLPLALGEVLGTGEGL